jgi:hypothetical protein
VYGTVFIQTPPDETLNERPVDPDLIREVFSVFDAGSWKLNLETQGGILFFHVARAQRQA